jgi:hypothetical protein
VTWKLASAGQALQDGHSCVTSGGGGTDGHDGTPVDAEWPIHAVGRGFDPECGDGGLLHLEFATLQGTPQQARGAQSMTF